MWPICWPLGDEMTKNAGTYKPYHGASPGQVLEDMLVTNGISHAEFARSSGCAPKLVSEIIAGKAAVDPKTARQFEQALGLEASIWLNIEAVHQLHQAKALGG
ncbi:hypothetical protein LCGC14_2689790 [marine sediment metagenome]|uniref:HTH cro/C1-type domain-containing protein n=1 Tax=marine sediment metagenome TaxID=412755 RepID=A0A0F8ZIU6_9ZZZZ